MDKLIVRNYYKEQNIEKREQEIIQIIIKIIKKKSNPFLGKERG